MFYILRKNKSINNDQIRNLNMLSKLGMCGSNLERWQP